jgi:hypothetical protein
MEEQNLLQLTWPGHVLGSNFCQQDLLRGRVCISVGEDKIYNKIDILRHCKKQVLEICAIHLETTASALIILCLYRARSGDFNQSINKLDATLKYRHNPKSEFFNFWQYKYRLS